MHNNNVSLTVVINGNNGELLAREFVSPLDRQTYVEGREGSNFTLRLRNQNAFRVLAIPSVDGLSVLDGKPAGEQSSGYILDAHQTLDIPGWVVDNGTAAKFFFSGLKADGGDDSYAVQSGQGPVNKGVIGLKVFKEKVEYQHNAFRSYTTQTFGAAPTRAGTLHARGMSKGIAPMGGSSDASGMWGGMATINNCVMGQALDSFTATASCMADSTEVKTSGGIIPQLVQQTLGTGFGEATDFATQKTEFKRGDLLAMMVVFYDDRRGLKKRGIEVDRPAAPARPSAFPADTVGCTPPAGWNR